jgi:hypothetical protein
MKMKQDSITENNLTKTQIKSLELIDEYLENVSDEEFYNDYLALETYEGITVKEYLEK